MSFFGTVDCYLYPDGIDVIKVTTPARLGDNGRIRPGPLALSSTRRFRSPTGAETRLDWMSLKT
jgi:hypothetical protein